MRQHSLGRRVGSKSGPVGSKSGPAGSKSGSAGTQRPQAHRSAGRRVGQHSLGRAGSVSGRGSGKNYVLELLLA